MCRKAYDFSERMDLKDLQKICQAEVINDKDWKCISKHQQLSEDFIREFADKVYWDYISARQQLSEDFMREFADKVDWKCISIFQHLSEAFIREFADKVDWDCISKYQHLSEDFIQEFKDKVDLNSINNSWCKLDVKEKKAKVVETGLYECHDDYFIAYKGIRKDRYSSFNFQYQYQPNETYETFADYSNNENSFGFSVWTYENAKEYCPDLVVTCKIYYEDVARVVHNGGKIRCSKITILN